MYLSNLIKIFLFMVLIFYSVEGKSKVVDSSYFIDEFISFGVDVKKSQKSLIYDRLEPYFNLVEKVDDQDLERVGLFVFDCVEEVCSIGFGSENNYINCCYFNLYNNVENWNFFIKYPSYVFERFGHKDNIKYAALYEMKFNGYFVDDFGVPFVFFSRCSSVKECLVNRYLLNKGKIDDEKYDKIMRIIEEMKSKSSYFEDMVRAYLLIKK